MFDVTIHQHNELMLNKLAGEKLSSELKLSASLDLCYEEGRTS